MKVTKLRMNGEKLNDRNFLVLITELQRAFAHAGFITDVNQVNSQALKIGLRSRCFSVNTAMHGRNLRHSPFGNPKLTDVPHWGQRVQFNNIVNNVFDRLNISAKVTSLVFIIRDGETVYQEQDWENQKPNWMHENEARGYYIEAVDEKAFIQERRKERNAEARLARAEKRINTLREEKARLEGLLNQDTNGIIVQIQKVDQKIKQVLDRV